MRRQAVLLCVLATAAGGCGEGDRAQPAPRPAVQKRTQPVWCPKQRYEQVRRSDGRFDVERVPHGTFDARGMLGLRQDDAERLAKANGCAMRVVERDGEKLARSDDLRVNRVNVDVERGYVTALQSIG